MAKNDKPLILVADDEPSTLALVANHLRGRGYRVTEASDGDEAWQKATDELPDLVVLDVMMPGMSGWEVCRKIRDAVSLAHTGVIMLTGIGDTLNELTSPLYGADAYLDKPFQFTRLTTLVQDTLKGRRGGSLGRPDHTTGPSTQLFKTSLSDIGELNAATKPAPARAPREAKREKVKAEKAAGTKLVKVPGTKTKAEKGASAPKTVAKPPVKATAKDVPKAAPAKTAAPAKATAKKTPAKAKSTPAAPLKKAPAKGGKKAPAKKAPAKPAAPAKKAPAKVAKPAVKKAPAKPAAPAKKAPAKVAKPAAKKAPAKAAKPAAKKAPAKATAKQAAKPAVKAPAKNAPAKSPAAKPAKKKG